MGLAGQVHVILEAAFAAQEAPVLKSPHRLSDSELAHRSPSTVIPAKAGIHGYATPIMPNPIACASGKVDPGFRREDSITQSVIARSAATKQSRRIGAHRHEIASLRSQ